MVARRYNLPPLNALKTFEAFGRHLNLQDAADELCVTQSAVSRQLRQLEEHLGVKLLERIGRNTQLTDLGRSYLGTLSASLANISDSTNNLFPQPQLRTRELLKLGCEPTFAQNWLAPRMGDFRTRHPGIELELYVNHNIMVETALERVDLEIYTGQVPPPEFHCEKLFQIYDFPVCSPALLKQYPAPKTPADLPKLPLLHEGSLHWWPNWLEEFGCKVKLSSQEFLVYDERLCLQLAIEGQGVALGDHISTHRLIQSGTLVRPIPEMQETEDWVYVLTREEKRQDPTVGTFCAWLREQMNIFKTELDSSGTV